jgi:hypothetical protein
MRYELGVGVATDYGLDNRRVGVRAQVGLHIVLTCSGAHLASYPMGTESFFPAGKAAGA